jgi:hypothetical protein
MSEKYKDTVALVSWCCAVVVALVVGLTLMAINP